jgi:hypothetical protein
VEWVGYLIEWCEVERIVSSEVRSEVGSKEWGMRREGEKSRGQGKRGEGRISVV